MFFNGKATTQTDMITLATDVEAMKPSNKLIMQHLISLLDSASGKLALSDLLELCNNPDHDISYTKATLLAEKLVTLSFDKYVVVEAVKTLVLLCVQGHGLEVNIDLTNVSVSPTAAIFC